MNSKYVERKSNYFSLTKDENKDFILRSFLEGNSSKLKEFGLSAERIDYNKPILTHITDADILVNGLGKVNKPMIDACSKLNLIHQVGTEIE